MHRSDQQHPDPIPAGTGTPPVAGRRLRRVALAIALGGGLALGAGGLAYAADDPSAAPSGPAAAPVPSGPTPSGPAAPSGAATPPATPEGSTAPGAAGGPKKQPKPHLDGTVKSLGTGRITIVDRDGFTRQITIADIPDGITVGSVIHAEGAVAADGVTLDATSVVIAPARPEGRGPHGPGGPQGPGGPHGPGGTGPNGDHPKPPDATGERPTPPSSASAPTPSNTPSSGS